MGQIYTKLGRKQEAINHFEKLLELNPSNFDSYYKILGAHGLSHQNPDDQTSLKILELLKQLQTKYPRVNAATRIALRYAQGSDFKALVAEYMHPLLIKGVPSAIQELKEFYRNNSNKPDQIEQVLRGWR